MIKLSEFVKQNVDWKFFNYLIDRATLLDDGLDSDYHMKVYVCLCEGETDNKFTLYHMSVREQKGEYNTTELMSNYLMKLFNNHGISYFITIHSGRPDNKKIMKSIIEKFLLSIDNKSNILDYSYYMAVVRPK